MGFLSWLLGRTKEASTTRQETLGSVIDTPIVRIQREAHARTSLTQIRWRDGSFPMEAVGESHYQQALIEVCGPHSRHGYDLELPAIIEFEPSNPHDSNAIVVKIAGKIVGYLPRDQAKRVGLQMREQEITSATCRSRVQGGWRTNQYDEGHFGVRLAIPTRDWIDFGTGRERPATAPSSGKTTRPKPAPSGPLRGEWVAIVGAPSDGEIANELANTGAHIMAGVGKSTSILVVAEERPFGSGLLTSKQYRSAEQKIMDGSSIRILALSEIRQHINDQST